LSVIIPAYNEEKRIGKTLREVTAYCRKNFAKYEIIVVDDGSSDKTKDVVMKFKGVRLLRNPVNKGKGYSVRRGLMEARYGWALFTDSDLATPISELKKFFNYTKQGFDVVIASRNLKESDIKDRQPFYRQFLGKGFPRLVNLLVLRDFKDTQCGFKLFKTEKIKRMLPYLTLDRFCFDVELLLVAKKAGLKIKEAPVTWIDQKGSKLRVFKDTGKMFLDLIRIKLNDLSGKYEVDKNGC